LQLEFESEPNGARVLVSLILNLAPDSDSQNEFIQQLDLPYFYKNPSQKQHSVTSLNLEKVRFALYTLIRFARMDFRV